MSEQSRKEFEEWAAGMFGKHNFNAREVAWAAWQASRQALVVELPRVTGDAVYDAQEVHDALDKAGLPYK